MALFESLFDLVYLACVIGLGIKLLLQKERSAKLFGAMAVLLGAGDAFHLIPRVISHWTENGFVKYTVLLNYGEAITSVTMTIFYVLYYYYYRRQTGDTCNRKRYTIYALTLLRIVLVMMPQNQWELANGSYTWAILRNIPFAIMGILLIYWSYKHREKAGMKGMALWITLSFAFYAPVVLGARFYPLLGALMMPKTLAYFLLVLTGYRNFIKSFSLHSLLENAFVYLIMGLLGGVFFREFTKVFAYSDNTFLGKIHVHVLVLGFFSMLILFLLAGNLQKKHTDIAAFLRRPILFWHSGVVLTTALLWLHGIIEVTGGYYGKIPAAAISGIAGIGHILLTLGMTTTIWKMIKVNRG